MMEIPSFKRFLHSLLSFALLAGLHSCATPDRKSPSPASSEPSPQMGLEARILNEEVQDASLVVVSIQTPATTDWLERVKQGVIYGVYEGKEIPIFEDYRAQPGAFLALFGVPYLHDAKQGVFEVRARGESKPLKVLRFGIKQGSYRSEVLRVDPDKVHPPEKYQARIQSEFQEVRAIYQRATPVRYWSKPFELPVESQITSPFGIRRIYNGTMKGFHRGTDLRAATGTPIRAPASGKVALAKNLYFSGNTVLLDHGYGLYTLYAHLNKIKVKRNQNVSAGKVLGLAGATGRVNGPHLHWGAVIHDVRIDPLDLTKALR